MDCERIRDAMAAYLYDEASDGERIAVEAHLSTCDACRARLDDDRDTLRRLDAWAMPAVATPRLAPPRQLRVAAWRAPLIGAAAAVLVFAALAWIGTRTTWRDGQLTIAFGSAASPSQAPIGVDDEIRAAGLRPLVRVVAREEIDGRVRSLARAFDDVLLQVDERREERIVLLLRALERQHARTANLLANRINRIDRDFRTEMPLNPDVWDAWDQSTDGSPLRRASTGKEPIR